MRLRFTRPAVADLDSIISHISKASPQSGRRVQQRVKDALGLLLEHPRIGARTSDPSIRRIVVRPYPYLIFYEATEGEIVVHAVRHAFRDPETMPGSRQSTSRSD